jgi:hypothetical protein
MHQYKINDQYLLIDNSEQNTNPISVYVTDFCSEYLFLNNLEQNEFEGPFPSYDYVLELENGNLINEKIKLVKLDI